MAAKNHAIDGEVVDVKFDTTLRFQVISGTPVFELSTDNGANFTVLDLTTVDSYPFGSVDLGKGDKYKWTLSGAVVSASFGSLAVSH